MLLTKLHIPTLSSNLVQRPGPFEKLNKGLKRKLILISAPAGFGKSTVLSDWVSRNNTSTAWFSVDANDNNPAEFLSYIISAIQGIKNEFGKSALELLKSPSPPNSLSIVNLLINDIISINNDILLILDDFHYINNNEINSVVSYLLEHCPENLHLVISSRSDPNLPIAKLRSQNQLIELRSNDLSFSANDISTLFNKKFKFKLSIENINLLESKTEGWIAGLQLAALSMQGHEDTSAFIEAFAGGNRYIMDYLIEEVLKVQSDDIKEFLLCTSIFKQISAPLCNAVLNRNDSQIILESLEKGNMFVFPLDSDRNWYRYHHLFADLLKQRLLVKDESFIEELHNKASEWFEKNKMYDLAIKHAFEIHNYNKSIQLLGEIAESMWENGNHNAILKYGDLLPDELIKSKPEFCLYYSWILITSGQTQKARPFLESTETITKKIINDKSSTEEVVKQNNKLLGKVCVALAYLSSNEEQSDNIFDYCKAAMNSLSEDDPLWYSWCWFSYGNAYLSIGDVAASIKAYKNALEYGKLSGNIFLMSSIVIRLVESEQQLGNYKVSYKIASDLFSLMKAKGYLQMAKAEWTFAPLYFAMGITEFMWTETEKATKNLKIAYDLSKGGNDFYLRVFILLGYTFLLKEQGDSDAENKISELDELMKDSTIPLLSSAYFGWKLHLLMVSDQIEEANSLIIKHDFGLNKEKDYSNELVYASYARLLILEYKLDEAEILISELYALASDGKRIERMIDINISYALLYKAKDNQDKAIKHLMEAMEIASNENILRFFMGDNNIIDNLLKEAFKVQATKSTKISNEFIDKLKLALNRKEKLKQNSNESDLSSRELDILKQLSYGLTNKEIADELYISVHTVKTHMKNILMKLEVDKRSKAIIKAQEMGII